MPSHIRRPLALHCTSALPWSRLSVRSPPYLTVSGLPLNCLFAILLGWYVTQRPLSRLPAESVQLEGTPYPPHALFHRRERYAGEDVIMGARLGAHRFVPIAVNREAERVHLRQQRCRQRVRFGQLEPLRCHEGRQAPEQERLADGMCLPVVLALPMLKDHGVGAHVARLLVVVERFADHLHHGRA